MKKTYIKMNLKIKFIFFLLLICSSAFPQNEQLTMSQALEKALENNYQLRIAGRDLEIASLNNQWGTAGRYPSISFDISSNTNLDQDQNVNNRILTGLGLNWILFDGFRVNLTKEQLELQHNLTAGALAVNIENTIEDVILAYNNILLQIETLEVFRKLMDLSYDRYRYEEKKHELGGSVTYNVLQAKNVYLSDKALFLKQEVEIRKAIRNLNILMGEDIGELWQINGKLQADTSEYLLSDLLSKMTNNNQVLKNQFINSQLTEKQTALKQSELYPSLRLSTGIQETNNRNVIQGSEAVTVNTFGPYVNLGLSYDLYNGGNRKRAIQASRIEEEIATVETERMEQELTGELLTIYDNYELRLELLNIAGEGIESAELNLQIAEDKFRTGAINSFNYRDIQLIYLNAALEHLSAIYNLVESHTSLTRITGGFIQQESEQD